MGRAELVIKTGLKIAMYTAIGSVSFVLAAVLSWIWTVSEHDLVWKLWMTGGVGLWVSALYILIVSIVMLDG